MIRIANLKIDPVAPEHIPESLAREECVLPIGFDGDTIRVVLGRRDDYAETIEKLEFVLNRRLLWAVADWDRIAKAIDEVYNYSATEISNCPLDFRFECPKRWLELRPTGREGVRFCESCRREVHLCDDENRALDLASRGECVAVFRAVDREELFMGLMEFTDESGAPGDG